MNICKGIILKYFLAISKIGIVVAEKYSGVLHIQVSMYVY